MSTYKTPLSNVSTKDCLISKISMDLKKISKKEVSDSESFRILRAVRTYFAEQHDCEKQQEKKQQCGI